MQTDRLLMYVPLLGFLTWAAVVDLRCRRVPNWLTFAILLSGLIQSLAPFGVISFGQSLAGLAVGFSLPFIIHMMGGMGAADVKLLAGVGTWLGPWAVLLAFSVAAIFGLVLILIHSLYQRRLMLLLKNTRDLLVNLVQVRRLGAAEFVRTGRRFKSIDRPLPYAFHLLIGTLGVVVAPLARSRGGSL
jgi:prepilin peptidase CpaA